MERIKGNCKVYIVGAGPGNPGLLTLAARDAIAQADVIIYDYLLPETLLSYARPKCVKIKHTPGSTSAERLEAFKRVVSESCKDGAVIVRLHNGDPFIFGMGNEEVAYLDKEGVPYEVIPGITSATGVPSYVGLPLTSRGISSSVVIVNGHPISPDEINWKALVEIRGTLVFLMGIGTAGLISKSLIEAGADPEAPCCAISRGTLEGQKVLLTKLGDLEEAIKREGIRPPGVIVIGRVVETLSGRG